jgi:Spy/CpxP family protein refolding chaperone
MKHWMICSLAAALMLGLAPANAQEKKAEERPRPAAGGQARPERPNRPGGGAQGADRLKTMTEQLGLSQDQAAKLKPILEAETKKMRELREDTALSQQDRREKMAKIRQETAKKIQDEKILTEEQAKKWKEIQEQRRQRPGGPGGQGGQGGGGNRPRRQQGGGNGGGNN